MHVAKLYPQLVMVINIDYLVVYFHRPIELDPVLYVNDIGLVEEVVGNWGY